MGVAGVTAVDCYKGSTMYYLYKIHIYYILAAIIYITYLHILYTWHTVFTVHA
jgi:hypothetical protein